MEQTIYIKGITCNSCVEKIKAIFEEKFNITDIVIEKDSGKVIYQHATFLKNSDISHVLE